jgi:hypothetical protein
MDRTNWLVDLYPQYVESATKHNDKLKFILNITPSWEDGPYKQLVRHFSGKQRKLILDRESLAHLIGIYNETSISLKDWWIRPFDETDPISWATEMLKKRIMAYGVPYMLLREKHLKNILRDMFQEANHLRISTST